MKLNNFEITLVEDEQAQQDNRIHKPQSLVKLAALSISTFFGQYERWSTFYNIFMVLIRHTNNNLTKIQKKISICVTYRRRRK